MPQDDIAQVADDLLFAFVNARNDSTQVILLPNLVEAVEELIAEHRKLKGQEEKKA